MVDFVVVVQLDLLGAGGPRVLISKRFLSYKGTCHVILLAKLLAKLLDMYLYKTATFPHQSLKSVSKMLSYTGFIISFSIGDFF